MSAFPHINGASQSFGALFLHLFLFPKKCRHRHSTNSEVRSEEEDDFLMILANIITKMTP